MSRTSARHLPFILFCLRWTGSQLNQNSIGTTLPAQVCVELLPASSRAKGSAWSVLWMVWDRQCTEDATDPPQGNRVVCILLGDRFQRSDAWLVTGQLPVAELTCGTDFPALIMAVAVFRRANKFGPMIRVRLLWFHVRPCQGLSCFACAQYCDRTPSRLGLSWTPVRSAALDMACQPSTLSSSEKQQRARRTCQTQRCSAVTPPWPPLPSTVVHDTMRQRFPGAWQPC